MKLVALASPYRLLPPHPQTTMVARPHVPHLVEIQGSILGAKNRTDPKGKLKSFSNKNSSSQLTIFVENKVIQLEEMIWILVFQGNCGWRSC